MRIGLFTDTYYPEINGVATSTQQLKRGLEALGHEVFVFAPEIRGNREKDKNVIRKYSLPFLLLKDRRVCLFRMRKALREIEKLKLDIVHSQTEFVMGHLARLTATKFNIPQIHTYHTVYEDYTHYLKIPGKNSEFAKNVVRGLSKILCERVDSVIVPTDKVKKLLKSYNVKKDIFVQATGVDYNKFSNPDLTRVNQLKEKYGIKSD
ncbi:MAG: glycosyltransferase, partial [Lachnospirales bacterium]